MAEHRPKPISKSAHDARQRRTEQTARRLGFVGHVEYRHVYSQAGGAQYGQAASPTDDLLIVYAEAFDRDADPEEFSLEAILAHERGHQLLAHNERLIRNLPGGWSAISEEIVASLLGSLLASEEKDQQDLLLKAIFEADRHGLRSEDTALLLVELRALLEKML
jgi:hypothetical protein